MQEASLLKVHAWTVMTVKNSDMACKQTGDGSDGGEADEYYTPVSPKSQVSIIGSEGGASCNRDGIIEGDNDDEQSLPIQENSTFDSDEDSSIASYIATTTTVMAMDPHEVTSNFEPNDERVQQQLAVGKEERCMKHSVPFCSCVNFDGVSVYFVALFAVFGYVTRVFVDRFFGLDCVLGQNDENAPHDFLQPFFSQFCITTNGYTDQKGGALFIDLPANMLGCFWMGFLLSSSTTTLSSGTCHHPLAWLRPDHPCQTNEPLLTGLRTGFCGCLTTFASWNTQMVRMMDGTDTVLGPQVLTAFCGYLIGISCSLSSYIMGRQANEWLRSVVWNSNNNCIPDNNGSPDTVAPDASHEQIQCSYDVMLNRTELGLKQQRHGGVTAAVPSSSSPRQQHRAHSDCCYWRSSVVNIYTVPLMIFVGLIALFLVGATTYDLQFYREMVLSSFMAPVGALIRWKLTQLNQPCSWPYGTLVANITASLLSISITAVQLRYLDPLGETPSWVLVLLPALLKGFAGSLSTVSTWIKELHSLPPTRAVLYGGGSILAAMLLGLSVFVLMVRLASQ